MGKQYFDDLSEYSYRIAPFSLSRVKNIGWINLLEEFPTGGISLSLLEKLKSITHRVGEFRPLVETIRKFPTCEKCGELRMRDPLGNFLPEAELWVPCGNTIYASPITIIHYIEVHDYRPPDEYIKAVEMLDPTIRFIGNEVYERKLEESGWVYTPE